MSAVRKKPTTDADIMADRRRNDEISSAADPQHSFRGVYNCDPKLDAAGHCVCAVCVDIRGGATLAKGWAR